MEELKSQLRVRKDNGKAYVTLNRPPANSYFLEYLLYIEETLLSLEKDKTISVVVINSASEKFFCAGADIKIFSNNSSDQNIEMVKAARKVTKTITSSDKIYIACIQGHILGGGLELAMACDIRLAKEGNYLVGLPEVKLGLMPGNGGTPRLIDLIGASKAMELLVTGDSVTPKRAYELGLFNQLYTHENFEEKVSVFVNNLAKGPKKAMKAIKNYVIQHKGMTAEQALQFETESVNKLYGTYDAIEGFKAFIEKRTPEFE
ncbi:enoyl-CoA hydratase/isomerase family protein [Tenacibaculum agarivorans]|uniref:enoyl-CoA hydratase/isomerase family protein n=1 Tax=Tenacibaculum agarivorans TaxID=1908389 RepID=UPI00094BA162|nr:enoyl-CoA hydratase/isomerase family protein [Tenacibaculum agarivorans]